MLPQLPCGRPQKPYPILASTLEPHTTLPLASASSLPPLAFPHLGSSSSSSPPSSAPPSLVALACSLLADVGSLAATHRNTTRRTKALVARDKDARWGGGGKGQWRRGPLPSWSLRLLVRFLRPSWPKIGPCCFFFFAHAGGRGAKSAAIDEVQFSTPAPRKFFVPLCESLFLFVAS